MENIFNELPTALPFYESEANQEIYKESVDENLFYKGYRISIKPLIRFRKSAETYVLGVIKDFEFKIYHSTLY